jgi:hypothetical protein
VLDRLAGRRQNEEVLVLGGAGQRGDGQHQDEVDPEI